MCIQGKALKLEGWTGKGSKKTTQHRTGCRLA